MKKTFKIEIINNKPTCAELAGYDPTNPNGTLKGRWVYE